MQKKKGQNTIIIIIIIKEKKKTQSTHSTQNAHSLLGGQLPEPQLGVVDLGGHLQRVVALLLQLGDARRKLGLQLVQDDHEPAALVAEERVREQ